MKSIINFFFYEGNTTSQLSPGKVLVSPWRCSNLRWIRPEQHDLTGLSQEVGKDDFRRSLPTFTVVILCFYVMKVVKEFYKHL